MSTERLLKITVITLLFVSSVTLTRNPAEIYLGYLGIFLFMPFFLLRYGVPQVLIVLFSILLITGIYKLSMGLNEQGQFIKIVLGVFSAYLFFYHVFRYFNLETETLFNLYLKAAYWVSIIGILQMVSYQIGFKPGYNFHWILNKWKITEGGNLGIRINSVFIEPTYYASFMAPAVFVAIYQLIGPGLQYFNKTKAIVVIGAYLLSFSGVGYFAIFLIFSLITLNLGLVRYLLVAVAVSVITFSAFYFYIPEFRMRFDSTVNVFREGQFQLGRTHGSAIILYNNYHIAMENFTRNPLFGTGLGSHPTAYEKYSLTKQFDKTGISLNKQDASSMLLRLLSETGLFGVSIFVFLMYRFFVGRRRSDPEKYWIISNAMLVLILVNLFRQGHYFLNGFPFYVWMYYYNWKNYKRYLAKEAESEPDEQAPHPLPVH